MTTSPPFESAELRDIETRQSASVMTRSAWRSEWKHRHHKRIAAIDVVGIIIAIMLAHGATTALGNGAHPGTVGLQASAMASLFIIVVLLFSLALYRSRDVSLIHSGAEEYRRVAAATVAAFACGALTLLVGPAVGLSTEVLSLIESDIVRIFIPGAFIAIMAALLTGRYTLRRDLRSRWARGEGVARTVVLGKPESATRFCDSVARSAPATYGVVGVCIPDFQGDLGAVVETPLGTLPVLGDDTSVELALQVTGADAVVVTSVDELGPARMKTLEWTLDSLGVELLIVPGIADTACSRINLRHIDNVPVLHVSQPRFKGSSALGKRTFDIAFGLLALVAAMPMLWVAALAIKIDDGGPVIFRQTRIGKNGKPFRILKFRTMTTDADARKDAERSAANDADAVFFKSANDSRITRIGRLLRATSLDELPQLFNVIGGSMSVVGPRPLVPGEGSSVQHFLARRSLVKPGMTGLWQVSGRSEVSDDERVRLDHSYVDNWSGITDLMIVLATVRAVLAREGAY
jgi:exopolysaccharide biosynthesis polyprenyl glycosylphosphotransferase